MKSLLKRLNKISWDVQLLSETESLKKYVEKLERGKETDKKGKDIAALSATLRWRYLKDLTTRAQKALWFMKAYGLEVEENNNTKHNLNLMDTPTTSNPAVPATNNEGCTYLSLQ